MNFDPETQRYNLDPIDQEVLRIPGVQTWPVGDTEGIMDVIEGAYGRLAAQTDRLSGMPMGADRIAQSVGLTEEYSVLRAISRIASQHAQLTDDTYNQLLKS